MKTEERLNKKHTFYYIKYNNKSTGDEYYIGEYSNYPYMIVIDENDLLSHGYMYGFDTKEDTLQFIKDNKDEIKEFINDRINSKNKTFDDHCEKHLEIIKIDAKYTGVVSCICKYNCPVYNDKYIICINDFYYLNPFGKITRSLNGVAYFYTKENASKVLDRFINDNKNNIMGISGLSIDEFKKERTKIIKL